jgi:hypothetical protein
MAFALHTRSCRGGPRPRLSDPFCPALRSNTATFNLRYVMCDQWYSPGGPVFFYGSTAGARVQRFSLAGSPALPLVLHPSHDGELTHQHTLTA